MNYLVVLLFMPIVLLVRGHHDNMFDRYTGTRTSHRVNTRECSIEVRPCSPHEGRRIDGTCNNFQNPTRGSARGPYLRMLKPDYGPMGAFRQSRHGGPLPSARRVRTALQATGRVPDPVTFNMAAPVFFKFINTDVTWVTGPRDYLTVRTYCCEPEGTRDPRCAPIPIPHDDPIHFETGIRCMNFSRLGTYQNDNCISKHITPEQVNRQTSVLDLSTIYGVDDETNGEIRLYEHGLLREEIRRNRHMPLNETRDDVCIMNRGRHSICYKFGLSDPGNLEIQVTLMTIYFYREHNRIARELQALNPCWNDEKLFRVARQINIATAANIFFYELLPLIMGRQNLLNLGLISDQVQFETKYDQSIEPLVYIEYEVVRRFYQTNWRSRIKKYDENYHYAGELSLADTTYRQEVIEEGKNLEQLNRGLFYQNGGRIDDVQTPDLSEHAFGLPAHDRPAASIQRVRDCGIPGYNKFRQLCGLKPATHFKDFLDVISAEKAEALKHVYQDVEDVDLMAGIMAEDLLPGTFVGPTMYCIMAKQLHVFKFSDRFWFERGTQVNSFSLSQLKEIRKTNMARVACDNAEGIKSIQRHAFLNVQHGNMQTSCSNIPGADLSKWRDETCHGHHEDHFFNVFRRQH